MSLFVHRNAGGRCPCGAENAACGPPSDVVPVDQDIEEVAAVSGPLKKYKVVRNGFETVMKLSEEDAKKLGVGPYRVADSVSTIEPVELADDDGLQEPQEAPSPTSEDAAQPDGAEQEAPTLTAAEPEKAPAKRRTTSANKARTAAANKAADGGN